MSAHLHSWLLCSSVNIVNINTFTLALLLTTNNVNFLPLCSTVANDARSHPHSLQKYPAAHPYSPWFTFTLCGQKKSLCHWNNVKHNTTLHHTHINTQQHTKRVVPPPLFASRLVGDVSQRGRGCCEDMPSVCVCVWWGSLWAREVGGEGEREGDIAFYFS